MKKINHAPHTKHHEKAFLFFSYSFFFVTLRVRRVVYPLILSIPSILFESALNILTAGFRDSVRLC